MRFCTNQAAVYQSSEIPTQMRKSRYQSTQRVEKTEFPDTTEDYRYFKTIHSTELSPVLSTIEEECDKLSFRDSFLFDRYPDHETIHRLCEKIHKDHKQLPYSLVLSLLTGEMVNRRNVYRTRNFYRYPDLRQ